MFNLYLFIWKGLAVLSGLITGFLIKLPFFEKIKENDELFEDQLVWILPSRFCCYFFISLNFFIVIFLFKDQCEIDATKNNEKN